MKKFLAILALALTFCGNAFCWNSETGSSVVSANENIVRSSIEATQILQSDTQGNFYGTNLFGGTVNYASFDSGGIQSFRNVVSSIDVVRLNRNQFSAWLTSSGAQVRVGVSNDDVFTIGTNVRIQGRTSGNQVEIVSLFTTSINTTQIMVSGNPTITSQYSTGSCAFTFRSGLLTSASC